MENPTGAGSRVHSTRSAAQTTSATSWSRGIQYEILGNLAHELRTPIQVLIGYLEILRDELGEELNPHHRHMIERMSTNTYDLAQTLENLMDFILAENDPKPGPKENITLDGLIAEITPPLEAANHKKQLNIRFDTRHAPQLIQAPRRALRSILLNLGLNAIKFTDSGTVTITIRSAHTRRGEDALEIEVDDTGPGLTTAVFEKVRRPFAQLSNSRHSRFRGLGLGLTMVSQYATTNGGNLELCAKPTPGARFVVKLPLTAETAHAAAKIPHSRVQAMPPDSLRKMTPGKPLHR